VLFAQELAETVHVDSEFSAVAAKRSLALRPLEQRPQQVLLLD